MRNKKNEEDKGLEMMLQILRSWKYTGINIVRVLFKTTFSLSPSS